MKNRNSGELPAELEGFQGRLEAAAERDISQRRRRRRIVTRAGLAAGVAVVALAVLSVVNVFGAGGPSIVERAAAALSSTNGNAIRHIHLVMTATDADGTATVSDEESWLLLVPPYSNRTLGTLGSIRAGLPRAESAMTSAGDSQLYDPSSNTIYVRQNVTSPDADLKKAQLAGKSAGEISRGAAREAEGSYK